MKYFRLYKILSIFRAYDLGELMPKHRLSLWLKLLMASFFWVKKRAKNKSLGERLCLAIQELGPIWIKFGQMFSMRHDLLPNNIVAALSCLQDRVDPFDGQMAVNIIEKVLGKPLAFYFDDFDMLPIASASIAQVHAARLKRGQIPVVIKVLRPDILDIIKADVSVMYFIAGKLPKWIDGGERLRAHDLVRDYERTILQELDLLQEANNTKRLRENFIDSNLLYVPYVYHELSCKNVLIEERVYGIPIAHIDKLNDANVDLKLLAEKGVETFFTQVFRDNFFHADMHPGNIFVDISDVANPRYIGIDCAIVGELTSQDQNYLAENFIAFFNRDYRKIARLYVDSGWVSEDTDIYAFEMAIRGVCEPVFAKPLGEISFAQVLFNLFGVARRFDMEVQPQLVLLEKTLFYIEGLGRQLYPKLDLWKTAKPFLENWYAQQMDIRTVFFKSVRALPNFSKLLPELPEKIAAQERDSRLLKSKLDSMAWQLSELQKRNTQQFCLLICFFVIVISAFILF